MQSTHLAFNKVNEENVYMCVGHPSKNDMISVINWLLNDDFTTIYNREFLSFIDYIIWCCVNFFFVF